jgi:GNAT superfamily N-acetyltransferase
MGRHCESAAADVAISEFYTYVCRSAENILPKVFCMVKIILLTKEYLDEAISLVKTIFPYKQDQKIARINLEESLTLKNFGQRYWVVAGNSRKLAGVTGLYLDAKDRAVIWLGWFGVHPAYRRRGIGSSLLEFTIKEAKRREFKTMKIYTSTDKHERAAHRLYESHGFRKINSCGVAEDIYYIKDLETDATKMGEQEHKK